MNQPWHTEGYKILSSTLSHLLDQQKANYSHDVGDAIELIAAAGRALRAEWKAENGN
jgi:hypothetical protein